MSQRTSEGAADKGLGRRDVILVALLFLSLTVVFFLPLVLGIGTSLLQPNFGGSLVIQQSRDKFHFIWNFWWLRYALSSHLGVLQTPMMFAPQGASLALQTMDYLDGALAAPIASIFGEVFSYNAVLLASFPLAGVTAFLLAWHLTRSRLASLVGGLVFAFFPQHVAQALFGHPNIANVAWIPAYFLCLMLAFESGRARYAVMAGALLAVLTLVDLEQLVMAAMATIVYLGYHLVATRVSHPMRFLGLSLLFIAVAVVATFPYLFSAYQAAATQSRPPPSITSALRASASLPLYLTPFPYNALYGSAFAPSYQGLVGGPSNWIVFTGWTVLALAIVGAITSSDKRKYFLIFLAAISLLISLGPSASPSTISFQSPYTFLYDHIQILHYFRATSRLSIYVMLALSNLAALGVLRLMKMLEGRRALGFPASKVLACVLMAMILFEYAPSVAAAPVPYSGAYGIIARDSGSFSVLELPSSITQAQQALYHQTIDGKPLVNGKISQSSQTVPSYVYSQPFLSSLVNPLASSRLHADIVNQTFSNADLAPIVLTEYGIKYVLVNIQGYDDPKAYNATYTKLHHALGAPVFQDQYTVLFELKQWATTSSILRAAGRSPLVVLGPGWGAAGVGGQQIAGPADLFVYVSVAGDYSIQMRSSVSGACLVVDSQSPAICGDQNPGTDMSLYRVPLSVGKNVVEIGATGDPVVSYIQVTPAQAGPVG